MENIKIESFGPISEAKVHFGDLTILVGPQASGKSILLQLLKLIIDKNDIQNTFEKNGYSWDKDPKRILDMYFGEGMSGIWTSRSRIILDDAWINKSYLMEKKSKENSLYNSESVFYIPAQRVVCLQNGWPRAFDSYDASVPYVLRRFSESIRLYMENEVDKKNKSIFPRIGTLKKPLRTSFNNSIFHFREIVLDLSGKKQFKLKIGKSEIPYMAWSAGQKEFMPLLLSFYHLCPPNKATKGEIGTVIIEEPEMGLHPQAINSVILQILNLVSRGYKVVVSTHSPVFLEFAWAANLLKTANAPVAGYFDLMGVPTYKVNYFQHLFEKVKNATIKTYFFDISKTKAVVKDISSLDAGSEVDAVSEWGGLSHFASRATDVVAKYVAD